ncbi:hypothetical protein B0I35DRAFT_463404 [Stachybotrys elegans]|uniref:Rhodopsin domain-containing protein n=1 Tax=Stachybotrys elegans TaxID=80388 RepID=A0A8K0SKL4_9HYPO|nr:hypothetical protein B0I35DRAFT_463404 [Stachybotrys elegans]
MAAIGPQGMTLDSFLAAGTALLVVASGFVTLRFVSDMRIAGRAHADDYLSVAALIFLAACFAMFYKSLQMYAEMAVAVPFPTPAMLRRTSEYAVAVVFLSGFAMWTAKAPVLVLLIRLFGIRPWLRYTCIATLVLTGVALVAGDAWNAATCMPPRSDLGFTPTFLSECTDASSLIGVIVGVIGLVADVVIFVLPLPIVAGLKMPLPQKIGLAFVFLVGLIGIVVSAVSLYYKFQSFSGAVIDVALGMTLFIVESSIILIVGCVPALRAFWIKFVVETAAYLKLMTVISGWSTSSRSTRPQKASQLSEDQVHINQSSHSRSKGWVTLDDQHYAKNSTKDSSQVQLRDFSSH